jgi:acyl dehydratase
MPLDPDLAVTTVYPDLEDSWDADRVILYHLGLGAGAKPLDPAELAYVDERQLKVLPTFSVIPGFEGVRPALQGPGLDYHLSRMLHGEQELTVLTPLPTAASIVTTPCVEAVYDKGKAGVAVLRADTRTVDGTQLCTNRFRLFIRGEGGFGGDSGPVAQEWETVGEPQFRLELPTLAQQAAIYRLSGDRNPLHIDPAFAARAGFDRPILHGLCVYGMVCKGIVDSVLDGDATAVGSWSARFASPVYPGDTVAAQVWRQGDRLLVHATVKEHGGVVLSHGVMTIR